MTHKHPSGETLGRPPTVEEMRWLLRFVDVALETLTPGGQLDLNRELMEFCGETHELRTEGGGYRGFMRKGVQAWVPGVSEIPRETLRTLQQGVQAGMTRLRQGARWELPAQPERTGLALEPGGALVRWTVGSFDAVFYQMAATLLCAWWPALRVCAAPSCQRQFLPDDARQKYCSLSCGQKTRWAKFAPKRKRDYERESVARIRRRVSPGAARRRAKRR